MKNLWFWGHWLATGKATGCSGGFTDSVYEVGILLLRSHSFNDSHSCYHWWTTCSRGTWCCQCSWWSPSPSSPPPAPVSSHSASLSDHFTDRLLSKVQSWLGKDHDAFEKLELGNELLDIQTDDSGPAGTKIITRLFQISITNNSWVLIIAWLAGYYFDNISKSHFSISIFLLTRSEIFPITLSDFNKMFKIQSNAAYWIIINDWARLSSLDELNFNLDN